MTDHVDPSDTGDDAVATAAMADYVLECLGTTLTAYICNARTRDTPGRWATLSAEAPSAPSAATVRLRETYRQLRSLGDIDGIHVARNWMLASNPRLGGVMPAQAIRDGNFESVRHAAAAFATDSYYA